MSCLTLLLQSQHGLCSDRSKLRSLHEIATKFRQHTFHLNIFFLLRSRCIAHRIAYQIPARSELSHFFSLYLKESKSTRSYQAFSKIKEFKFDVSPVFRFVTDKNGPVLHLCPLIKIMFYLITFLTQMHSTVIFITRISITIKRRQ